MNLSESEQEEYDPLQITPVGRIIQRILLPLICVVGIVGIILTLIVLSRKAMHTSTNCYLMALATTDLLFLLILATHLAENHIEPLSIDFYNFSIYVTYSGIFMQIFLLASVWLTVMLAIERFIGICKPFLASSFCTIPKATIMTVFIYLFAVLCRSPNFWEVRVCSINDSSMESNLMYIEGAALSFDKHYILWYPWIIDGFVTSIVPFFLLLILNCRLIWEVKKSTKYLQQNQMLEPTRTALSIHREDLQVTIMLISVIIVFFICQAPYVIYTAVVSINKFMLTSHYIMVFRRVTILMLTLKSSINFVIYCWFSEKFVNSLKRLFETRRRSSSRSSSVYSKRLSSIRSGCERYRNSIKETFL